MLDCVGRMLSAPFSSRPILVVGTGRSGTSVLLQALGRHPQIFGMPGEAPYLTSLGSAAQLLEGHADHAYYVESLKVSKSYLFKQLRRMVFEVAGGPDHAWRLMTEGLLRRGSSPVGRRFWCAKSFPGPDAAAGLLALYPSLRFIYIVRNGCDVVHSMSKFDGFAHEDFETHCRRWAQDVEKYRYLVVLKQSIVATHESLLAEPETFFERLFTFLGLPSHPEPARFAMTTLVHPLDHSTMRGVDPRSEMQRREPVWQKWTQSQRDRFRDICEAGMRELGYSIPP
jgi:hypothetical protein